MIGLIEHLSVLRIEGRTRKEIAVELGVSLAKVKRLLSFAGVPKRTNKPIKPKVYPDWMQQPRGHPTYWFRIAEFVRDNPAASIAEIVKNTGAGVGSVRRWRKAQKERKNG
ncbi:hypothetical protein [Microcystis phage Mwe-JY26]